MILTGASVPAATPADRPTGEVVVQFQGLRSTKGMIRACLTRSPRFFPHCDKDPASYKGSVAAANGAQLRFENVEPGKYALTVLHDENQNFRADMMLGIPREGVGFSRNPRLIMSAPKFSAVEFPVANTTVAEMVRLQYFL
jgi:uncharacterized protein (DUF2141 family)